MKNSTKILVAVATMATLSCATDATEDLSVVVGEQTEISISLEDSRTQLGEKAGSVYPLYWSEEDKISVNGVESSAAVISGSGESATFTVSGVLSTPYCITYPAANSGEVVFAAKQIHTANNTFGSGVTTMYGYSESDSGVVLNHLTGVLKIGITGSATLTKAQISTIDRQPIAGAFAIDFATGKLTPSTTAAATIEYSFGEGVTLSSEPTYLHIAVPAGVYKELYVTLYDSEGKAMYAVVKANDGKPLTAGNVREFSKNITYNPLTNITLISNADELIAWGASAATSSTDVVLVNDIDMTDKEWTEVEGFLGSFNGNGYAIKGLTRPLFGTTKAKCIKGVHLEDVNIVESASPVVGCLADIVNNASAVIEDCSASGTLCVVGSYTVASYTAGLIGQALTKVTVSGLVNRVNVDFAATTAKAGYYCGCVGRADGDVTNCHNLGTVTITGVIKQKVWMCGIGGYVLGTMTNCTNGSKDDETHTLGAVVFKGEYNAAQDLRLSGITPTAVKGLSHCCNYAKIEVGGTMTKVNSVLAMGINMNIQLMSGPFTDCKNYGPIVYKATPASATATIANVYLAGITNVYLNTCTLFARNVNYGKIEFAAKAKSSGVLEIGGVLNCLSAIPTEDVANYGEIEVAGTVVGDCRVGGIAGYTTGGNFKGEIINGGAITIGGSAANVYLGGLLGYWSTAAGAAEATFTNRAKITYAGSTSGTLKMGGLFGELTVTAPCNGSINSGDIVCGGSYTTAAYAGGVAGYTTVPIENATCVCTFDKRGIANWGMILGVPRSESVKAVNCKIGGSIITDYNIEDEIYTSKELSESNYYKYIYANGETTDWSGTDNYDGCTYLAPKHK